MKSNFLIYVLLSFFVGSMLLSCGDSEELDETVSSSTAITSFSLLENDNVMTNLDSVFFTIDQVRGEIYNADSLPMGTDVSKLCVSMTYSAASSAMFHVAGGEIMRDTTFAYSDEDSIDFTGDVKFTIVSQDLTAQQVYSIKVNVHKVEPDSLFWGRTARRDLPGFRTPIDQKTVQLGGLTYCLLKDAGGLVISTCSDLARNRWEKERITLPFVPKIKTLTATDDALYIMDENNALYTSADGKSWSACGETLYSIVGTYGNRLLGVVKKNGVYMHTEYPMAVGYEQKEVPSNFPVEGVSQMVSLVSKWAVSDQRIMFGGKTSTGMYLGVVWGFDGENWGVVSKKGLYGLVDATLVSYYYTYLGENNITTYQYPALLVMGGTLEDGATLNDRVYISSDNGLTWKKANETLQLPEYMENFTNAQALVQESTLTVSRSATDKGWIEMPITKLPASMRAYSSRAIAPIDSWECPYIYLFGGTNAHGVLYNNIWRGVINRLTFQPLY